MTAEERQHNETGKKPLPPGIRKGITLNGVEERRVYMVEGEELVIDSPRAVYITDSGSHLVQQNDGYIVYVNNKYTKTFKRMPVDIDNPILEG